MNKTFYTTDSIPYSLEIGNEKLDYKDIDPETLDLFNELGFFIVINNDKLTFTADNQSIAKWILKELEQIAELDDDHELYDYLRFIGGSYGDEELVSDIVKLIPEVKSLRPDKTTYRDLIDHIMEEWYLSDSQKNQLQKEDADYYQEMQERRYH